MTNFSLPFNVGGIPTIGSSGFPLTFGNVFWVDANAGSDGNLGDGPASDHALKTVLAAYNKTVSNNHDVILLSAASAHVIAAEIAVTKNRIHFVGLGGGSRYIGQRTRFEMGVTTGTGIAIIKNTGVGNTFTNIKFRSVDTLSTSLYAFADGGEFTQITNCSFEKDEDLNQTGAAEFLCNCDTGYYKNCAFGNMIYSVTVARGCVLITRVTIAGKVARDCIFEDCLFLNKTTSTGAVHVLGTTATDVERFMWFKNCAFMTSVLSTVNQVHAIHNANALTDGEIICQDCMCTNVDDFGTVTGLFTNSPTSAAAGTETIQATA